MPFLFMEFNGNIVFQLPQYPHKRASEVHFWAWITSMMAMIRHLLKHQT
jgi:hypothetical protein